MILRRFMQHVREQNWFAVGLDVIVVIVGIFLGLQVQAWYEDQQNRTDEQRYLNRLHDEVTIALGPAHGLMNLRTERYDEMVDVLEILNSNTEEDAITSRQCYAMIASSILVSTAAPLPTMDELLSTGNIAIINNEEVRAAISFYNVRLPFLESMSEQVQIIMTPIIKDFPDLFELDMTMTKTPTINEDINSYNHVCKLDLMRENTPFKNNLTLRTSSLKSYIDLYHALQIEDLNSIHQALDTALGLEHEAQG